MSQALSRFARDLAIDLGTCNTLIYVQGRGVALDEPSVVAVQNGSATGYRQVVAVGEEAKRMLGRTPGSISAIRPLRSGVIADFKLAEEMLRHFIGLAIGRQGMLRPRILVSVPSGITDVERRAVFESARAAGGREIFLVSEPLAAALGAALPVMEPTGSCVVDIGGGTTEVAVISMGGLVRSASLRVAGDQMDEAIVQMLKNEHGIQIGERMAEELKITLGCAMPQEVKSTSIRGRDVRSGATRAVTVTSEQLRLALAGPIRKILEAVQSTLADTPPELAADLVERGVVLCGGGAMLAGLADWFSQSTGLDFQLTDEPLSCVVRGAGMALEDPILLNRVAMD
jgi:rod shape-determining protein MreB